MNPLRIFALLLLLALSQGATATTYYWESSGISASSPSSVCQQLSDREWAGFVRNGEAPYWENLSPLLVRISDVRYDCTPQFKSRVTGNLAAYGASQIGRYGDSCATGSIYNNDSASCELTQCKAKEGRFLSFATSGALPNSACIGGCAAALSSNTNYTDTKGNKTYYYDGNYTGNDCSGANPAGYTACNLEQDCTKESSDPETDASNECKPGADEVDSSGRTWKVTNCTKNENSTQAGEEECNWGTVQGNWTCVVKPPKSTSTKTETETKTTTNADGSKDTKQTTTTTETKCTGVNSCNTTTTTTTNSNHTNADGSAGDSSSSCKGAKCSSDNGDGEGEEEEGDDDVAGPTKSLIGKASEGFGETEAEWQTKIDAGRQQLDGLIDQYSALFSGAFDLNVSTGGGSLPCLNTPISALGQSADIKICPADYEDQLIYLKYILLAVATILAGFIILRN